MTDRNSSRAAAPRKASAFIRGEAGMRRTDEELERAKQRSEQRKNSANQPFRFYVPIGDTRRVIIVDDKPDFFLYEHALKDQDGKWGRLFTGCIKEHDNCPVCQATGKESYYAMVLTCIDLTPFKMRDGSEVEYSRKLLIVKPAQQKKFLRFYNKEGTLRGAMFDMTRDGDKDSSIGNDIDFVEFVEEDEMDTYVREWKDREGKKHTDACSEVYDYESLFEEPTEENLRAVVGGEATPGSRASNERALGGGRRDVDPPVRGAARRGGGDSDDWGDAKDTTRYGEAAAPRRARPEPEEEEAPPPPPARRGRPAPEEDVADAAPPPPPARRGRVAPAAAAPARRGRAPAAADDSCEDF